MRYRILCCTTPVNDSDIGTETVVGWAFTRWGARRKLKRFRREASELRQPDRSYITFNIE